MTTCDPCLVIPLSHKKTHPSQSPSPISLPNSNKKCYIKPKIATARLADSSLIKQGF